MLEKAFEWIKNHGAPTLNDVGNIIYSDRKLYPVEKEKCAEPIKACTLTALVDYLRSSIEDIQHSKKYGNQLIVHVVSPTQVILYTSLNEDKNREILLDVNAQVPAFSFGSFYDLESFNIALQSKFIPNEYRELLLKFTGTVESGTIANYGDDGVTQKATIKTGITSKSEVIVPNPVRLEPYSTFLEIKQPERLFVFRMRESRDEISAAIFEADGGAWKTDATNSIHQYLSDELGELIEQNIILLMQ